MEGIAIEAPSASSEPAKCDSPSLITRLPPEILGHLLAFTVPPLPTFILRYQPAPIRRLLNLNHQRQTGERFIPLLLICKQWTEIIAPLVWNTRTVLAPPESHQLLATLESQSRSYDYGSFIGKLSLKIQSANADILESLLSHCPNLISLELSASVPVHPIPTSFQFPIISRRCPRLRSLSLEHYMLSVVPASKNDVSSAALLQDGELIDPFDPHNLERFLNTASALRDFSLLNCDIPFPRLASACGAHVTRLKGTTVGSSPNTNFHRLLAHCPHARIINLTAADLPRLDLIPGRDSLEILTLLVPKLTPADLSPLVLLSNLNALSIFTYNLAGHDLAFLSHPALSSLSSLEIRAQGNAGVTGDAGFRHISHLTKLRRLRLSDLQHVTDVGFALIEALVELETLEIGSLPLVSAQGLRAMGRLSKLSNIKIFGADVLDDTVLAGLDGEKLECLQLSYPRVSAEAWEAFAKRCVNIRSLVFGTGDGLGEGFFRTLNRTAFRLEELSVGDVDQEVMDACRDLKFFRENVAMVDEGVYWKKVE